MFCDKGVLAVRLKLELSRASNLLWQNVLGPTNDMIRINAKMLQSSLFILAMPLLFNHIDLSYILLVHLAGIVATRTCSKAAMRGTVAIETAPAAIPAWGS
jgi:hypothetical protein